MTRAVRNRQLRKAIFSSIASKATGFLSQVFALPMVLAGLGQDHFAAFMTLTALAAWISPLGLGVLPALTREFAGACAARDDSLKRKLFGVGFYFTFVIATALLVIILAATFIVDPRALAALPASVSLQEARLGFAAAFSVVAVHFFATLAGAIRAGYQEGYIQNSLSFVANILALCGVMALASGSGTIAAFTLAIYAPLTILYLLDMIRIIHRDPVLWPPEPPSRASLFKGDLKTLFSTSGMTWAGQVHYFLTAFFTVVLVAHISDTGFTVAFGSMMRAVLLGYGVIALFVWPLVPALTDAVVRRDLDWVRICYRRLAGGTLLLSALGAVIIATAGPWLLRLWMGELVHAPMWMAIGFGGYFLAWNCNFVGFNVCLALGETKGIPLTFLTEAALVYLLSWLLVPPMGASGVAVALAIAGLSINFWWLPLKALRGIRSLQLKSGGTRIADR